MEMLAIFLVIVAVSTNDFWRAFACVALAALLLIADRFGPGE